MPSVEKAWVYAASDGERIKVGHTNNPKLRAYHLGRDAKKPVKFVHLRGPTKWAVEIENTAHWLLADHQDVGEWFKVDAATAADAIRRAGVMVASGEFPKEKAIKGARQLPLRLDQALDRSLRPGETRRDFLKVAVERELAHRAEQEALPDAA